MFVFGGGCDVVLFAELNLRELVTWCCRTVQVRAGSGGVRVCGVCVCVCCVCDVVQRARFRSSAAAWCLMGNVSDHAVVVMVPAPYPDFAFWPMTMIHATCGRFGWESGPDGVVPS